MKRSGHVTVSVATVEAQGPSRCLLAQCSWCNRRWAKISGKRSYGLSKESAHLPTKSDGLPIERGHKIELYIELCCVDSMNTLQYFKHLYYFFCSSFIISPDITS